MRWLDLLFAHWPVERAALERLIPPQLELETFDGQAWLGIVPFTMTDVSLRGVPAVPRFSTFPETNVRTYVRHRGLPGVWFLSLDADSWVTVLGARRVFHLPYAHARMDSNWVGDEVAYHSVRDDRSVAPARFDARYRATGPVRFAEPGSFEDWSTNRLRLFSADRTGAIWRSEIAHAPWPLQAADAILDASGLAAVQGLALPTDPPHLRFARRLDVRGWLPVRAG
jgi:uncharacterized protein YqjF (DUF2071 family)